MPKIFEYDKPTGEKVIGVKEGFDNVSIISSARIEYYQDPIEGLEDIAHVMNLETIEGKRERGYGSRVMEEIKAKIIEKGLIGLLKNGINDPKINRDFHKERGWKYVSEKYDSWMYFSNKELTELERENLIRFIKFAFPPEDFN